VESEERYRTVIENASDMIQSVRPDGTLEFVNKAWHDKLKYRPDELPGLIVWDTIHPDEIEHCQKLFMIAMQGETIPDVRTVFVAKDGTAVPVEGSVTTRMVDGRPIASHAFFRDISERLRAEELRARNEQLERERMAQYLEKMAALGKLAAGLAHELNNPAAAAKRSSAELIESLGRHEQAIRDLSLLGLTSDDWDRLDDRANSHINAPLSDGNDDPVAISEREDEITDWLADHGIDEGWNLAPVLVSAGVTDAALEEIANDFPSAHGPAVRWLGESLAVRKALDVICRSTSRMSDLVTAIKAYTYMDRAAEQLVDIHEGLDNTRIILAHRLRNVTVRTDYDRSLPPVRAFGSGLNQVWTNLLDNAIDATNRRGTVSIRTSRAGDQVCVEIADDGNGIPAEHLTRIFEPFFTTKEQGRGMGLGLDTAWRIITDDHGGSIQVESEPGRTVFRVLLPIAGQTSERG
jgi:PAS domain S-box-containing protein